MLRACAGVGSNGSSSNGSVQAMSEMAFLAWEGEAAAWAKGKGVRRRAKRMVDGRQDVRSAGQRSRAWKTVEGFQGILLHYSHPRPALVQ
jgi:hypothetical protein